jgi:two-component system sensor histidine kinase AgrC
MDTIAVISNVFFVIIFSLTAYKKNRNLPVGILFALITVITTLLASLLASMLIDLVIFSRFVQRDEVLRNWLIYALYIALVLAAALPFSRLVGGFLSKKLSIFSEGLKRKFAIYINIGAFITAGIFIANIFLINIVSEIHFFYLIIAVLMVLNSIYLVFAVYTFTNNFNKDSEISHKNEMLGNLQAYTDSIEYMSAEMKRFQHDHTNLLMGFYKYIEENDTEGIRRFYMEYLSPFVDSASPANTSLDQLKNIKIPELKSILSLKLLNASYRGISIHIEVFDAIEDRGFDLADLCRIAGNLLDNAVEACPERSNHEIKFIAYLKGDATSFVFINTCLVHPKMSAIFEKGYTTKKEDGGIGLYIVKTLVDKHENMLLDTSVKGGEFIQHLTIV